MVAEKSIGFNFFSKDTVETLGTMKTPVKLNNWLFQHAKITVVADGVKPGLGGD